MLSSSSLSAKLSTLSADDQKVVINVGGNRHETVISTLLSKPGTRLSLLAKRREKGSNSELFFDRHPGVFSTVMDYYRCGELHVPLDVCGAVVKRELEFWNIPDSEIQPCCWVSYSSFLDNMNILATFNQSVEQESKEIMAADELTGWSRFQMKMWMILDHPRSSRLAMGYAITSFLFVLVSIAGFCIETHMAEAESEPDNVTNTISNLTDSGCHCKESQEYNNYKPAPIGRLDGTKTASLQHLDYICTAFFTAELIIRVIFAPSKLRFFKSPMNIIDILALLPLYAQIIALALRNRTGIQQDGWVVEMIVVLRIVRIFRIFHLVKHYKALMILVHAIRASVQELLMLAIFLFIAMLVFSTLVYYSERFQTHRPDIPTIPVGFWWSIITMTTVGYGDVKPKTAAGQLFGGICAVCGVLLVALTIPVISNNFTLFYLHARTREKIVSEVQILPSEDEELMSPTPRSNTPNGVTRKRPVGESRALLRRDSNSSESGIMLHNRIGDELSGDNPNLPEAKAPIFETSQL